MQKILFLLISFALLTAGFLMQLTNAANRTFPDTVFMTDQF